MPPTPTITKATPRPAPSPAPTGRPLDNGRDVALRRAALQLVAEIGYDRLTIDAVAARARAGKATVYRRWTSKADLVADAFLEEMFGGLVPPDTGSLRDDLVSISTQVWLGPGSVPRAQVMAGVMSALLGNADLRAALNDSCRVPQGLVDDVIHRAVVRGEIPEPADPELIGSALPSLCMFRLVRHGAPPEPDFVESVIDQLVIPALRAGGKGPR